MNSPTKIASLVPYRIFPASMGGQKAIALFYTWLGEILPVTIISVKSNEIPPKRSFDFIPLLGNSKLRYINPFLFFRMRRIIKERQLTHLILEHPYFGWLGSLLKDTTNIKLIVRSHNIEGLRFKSTGRWWWPILWRYECVIHRKADMSFFITAEDMNYAISNFGLSPKKCMVITYGTDVKEMPLHETKNAARQQLHQLYQLAPEENILLFNGTLDYKPNQDALEVILKEINPLLLQTTGFKYKIIICGKGLPQSYKELAAYKESNIIYAGFVDDIAVYFNGADIFINPVTGGGGIKTKLVEALAAGLSSVSTVSGAIGISPKVTGNKLLISTDSDWDNFVKNILATDISLSTPQPFFEHFFWGNIVKEAGRNL